MKEKSVRYDFAWNRFLIGFHFIEPAGNLFWSIWLGPLKISYDYKLSIHKEEE